MAREEAGTARSLRSIERELDPFKQGNAGGLTQGLEERYQSPDTNRGCDDSSEEENWSGLTSTATAVTDD